MPEIKSILWPVDFSDSQNALLPWVLYMLEKHQARLHLLHVTMDLEQCAGMYDMGPLQHSFMEGAQNKMDRLCRGPLDGQPGLEAVVCCGDPVQKILEYAEAQKIDLIVMSTHGRKGLGHTIMGSVAENLVRQSPVPVLTINPHR